MTIDSLLSGFSSSWFIAIVGLLAGVTVLVEGAEVSHYRKLYQATEAARAADQSAVAAATAKAQADDAAHLAKVQAAQTAVTDQVRTDYENQIETARTRAASLVAELGSVQRNTETAHRGSYSATVPAVPPASGGTDGAAGDNGLSGCLGDAASRAMNVKERLTATETAIRLAHLQSWVDGIGGTDADPAPPKDSPL